jgi:putative transposase
VPDQAGRLYPSDLSDWQWQLIRRLIPPARSGGRPRTTDPRQVLNALLYLTRSGCAWRYLPASDPPWRTVYDYFIRWKQEGVLEKIHALLVSRVRLREGRAERPSVWIIDSQSIRSHFGDERGYDGFKKIRGRKRQILVDSLGLVHGVRVHAAHLQDRDEGYRLVEKTLPATHRFRELYADAGYAGSFSLKTYRRYEKFPVITRSTGMGRPAENVLSNLKPTRWVVERTFAWFNHYRRLSRDYERSIPSSESMIRLAMTQLLLRRLVPG